MENKELSKEENNSYVTYERECIVDKLYINARSRQEAIDKLSEFVNNLKYGSIISIWIESICRSEQTQVIHFDSPSIVPREGESNPPAQDAGNTILPNG